MHSRRGFTLIELLVTIGILTLFAAIVIVSLDSARARGRDTKVIADVQQSRLALFVGYTGTRFTDLMNGSAACNTPALISGANHSQCINSSGGQYETLTELSEDANSVGSVLLYSVNSDGNSFAVRGRLSTDPSLYHCIDSAGDTNLADNILVVSPGRCN